MGGYSGKAGNIPEKLGIYSGGYFVIFLFVVFLCFGNLLELHCYFSPIFGSGTWDMVHKHENLTSFVCGFLRNVVPCK